MREDPDQQQWLVRAITLPEPDRRMIGHAGFHGPPGTNGLERAGSLEIGYTVFEEYRGHGYATETARALLDWARDEHGIRHFIASVSPGNDASLAIVRKLGFVETGSQWDDEDGEELVFELSVVF
jgi:RimJ/RimL family protein N-acetyltransferase